MLALVLQWRPGRTTGLSQAAVPAKGPAWFATEFAFWFIRFFLKARLTGLNSGCNMLNGCPLRQGGRQK
jgi:hypothetical protein